MDKKNLNMLSFITKIFGGLIIGILAHKIFSIIIALLIGFICYIAFTDPEFTKEVITKINTIFPGIKI